MTADKSPKKAPVKDDQPHCTYCRTLIDCIKGDVEDENYWSVEPGVRACDECLLLNADDFESMNGEDRIFALRLLFVAGIDIAALDETLASAETVFIPQRITQIRQTRGIAFTCFQNGQRLAAMMAGQAFWNDVNALHGTLIHRVEISRDRKRQEGTRKERNPELQAWIKKQVDGETGETTEELWKRLPRRFEDAIGRDRFTKRVTRARKDKLAASK